MKNLNNTINRPTLQMTNGKNYIVSHATRSIQGLKSNHVIMTGVNGIKYVVNVCNGFAYKATN